ncbi:MAG: protein-L-isoaspartate O-methyltransferase [Candidatus Pacebacteria bacterium]|nr:protein-L-isoaspartate O-methyltransferase [Candidatus Paceibacterota bacterium]
MAKPTLNELITELVETGWLKSSRLIEAFYHIKREEFIPSDIKDLAYSNEALPIGFGQTISQPLVGAFMLELLNPLPGEKILDIGAGSGWTSALLAHCVSPTGIVIAVEIIPELVEFGKSNVAKYNFLTKGIVKFIGADGKKGYLPEAPYDKILASASAQEIPKDWYNQLKIGGRMVVSRNQSVVVVDKLEANKYQEKIYEGFVFVPLV